MATTSDPQFGFAPSFEACLAQSIRRSLLKVNSEYEVSRDYQVPMEGNLSKQPHRSSTSSSKKKSKKHKKRASSGGERNKSSSSRSSNSSSLSKRLQYRDIMDSGPAAMTDQTEKFDNLSSKRRGNSSSGQQERAARSGVLQRVSGEEHERSSQLRRVKQHDSSLRMERAATSRPPGVQHVSGKEHERSEVARSIKDPRIKHRGRKSAQEKIRASNNNQGPSAVSVLVPLGVQHVSGREHRRSEVARSTKDPRVKHREQKSAQEKIRAFNNNQGPSPVSVSDQLDGPEDCSNASNANGGRSSIKSNDLLAPTNVKDGNAYMAEEKARLLATPQDANQQENFMEQYTVVSRGLEDGEEDVEDFFGVNVAKRFNDSFNLSQEFALQQGDEEKGRQSFAKDEAVAASGSVPKGDSNNRDTRALAACGVASAPTVEHGTTGEGFSESAHNESFDDEGLTIAIAVDDSYYDGQSQYYHHAIEYIPDAKPSLLKNRRFRYYAIMVAVFACLASGTIAAVLLLTGSDSKNRERSPSAAPSDAPTTAAEGRYRNQFFSVVGSAVNEDGTAHDRAARWIMYEDRLRLTPIDDNLIQRYLLAYFYFATTSNEEMAWKSCNRPTFNQETTCNHQIFMRNPEDDSIYFEAEPATRWLSNTHECEWIGVQCNDGQIVIAIDIRGQDLAGPLPVELAYMPFLNSIALAYNAFTGTIPVEYAQMRHLINLEVHGNELSGTVPTDFWNTLTLQNFNIAENDITGTLSTEIGQLTGLKGLHFSENHITGSLPSELGNLIYLSYMRVDGNQLTGSIPTVLGKLGVLQELWLQENLLSGTIPTEVGVINELIELRLDRNRIYGTIPEQLWDNKVELTKLDLQDLILSGTLSTKIGNLKNLESLRLRRNRLTGTVPTELAKIGSLRLAWLHLNEFTGSIPLQICSRVGPGFLEFLNADCGPEGAPAQECACCHGCCDRQTELCQLTDFNPSS